MSAVLSSRPPKSPPSGARLAMRMTPHGHLLCEFSDDAPEMESGAALRLTEAFSRGGGEGLLQLGAGEAGRPLPPALAWWRAFAARYVSALCLHGDAAGGDAAGNGKNLPAIAPPGEGELATLTLTAPMMPGAEYISPDALRGLWDELAAAAAADFSASGADLQAYLRGKNPAWNLVGRVHFNLAENRGDPDLPFAFMATYTTQLSAQGRARHLSLGQALRDYAAAEDREKLLALLQPVQRASETCGWLRPLVDEGEIFHPLRWTAGEASRLLGSAADLEQAGVVLRMPPAWRSGRPARPQVKATVGGRPPSKLGLDGLLDFSMGVTLDGETLSVEEVRALLDGSDGLALLRGQWVEVDRARLERTLHQFEAAQALAGKNGLSFAEAMRMLAGAGFSGDETGDGSGEAGAADWSRVTAGPWLAQTLRALRSPEVLGDADPGPGLLGQLRPYQQAGVQWLHLLTKLGLGACLADDMGLGKTIQILALLLALGRDEKAGKIKKPSLLVAPASLLANWQAEIARFSPGIRARVLHPSAMTAEAAKNFAPGDVEEIDLAITSYGTLLRMPVLQKINWRLAILDEAQAIKNPNAKQTRAAKSLRAAARIALTGTPVENSLSDLWSIFDFINPGLLGGGKQFSRYVKTLEDRAENPYGPLRELVRPYILRRMKTDRAVIADLPDKTEVRAYCHLGRKQAALYAQAVEDLERALEDAEGIRRRGIVLAMLMRLKQICNHPAHWLKDGDAGVWPEADSGKFLRLREIVETVAARQEKILVFTQFREATAPLADFLSGIFGRPGLVLHGETAVKKRGEMVQKFQNDEKIPFFVLSLKAGGSGLTLTAASHVVHFDRWWNPAVENQATDRAFRIGQKKNVMVHKFVCRGTVEDKIDAMIEAKKSVSDALLAGGGGELDLASMSDEALLRLVSLDLNAATATI